MGYRHEYKHLINPEDRQVILSRLRALGLGDPHAPGGEYMVRSLYFDDGWDTALRQKLDGVGERDKFRIRYYNGDSSFIRLEKKSKRWELCLKRSAALNKGQVEQILAGSYAFLKEEKDPLLVEFYGRLQWGLRPAALVDYRREPFVYSPGNVRVTIDRDIRTGACRQECFFQEGMTLPADDPLKQGADDIILEIKYDAFLPDIIRQAVQLGSRPQTAFSKYAQCRRFG